jgi:hypothetical protein
MLEHTLEGDVLFSVAYRNFSCPSLLIDEQVKVEDESAELAD